MGFRPDSITRHLEMKMKKIATTVGFLFVSSVALAQSSQVERAMESLQAQLTLNDLPAILKNLRGCFEVRGLISTTLECRVATEDMWIAIKGDGKLTMFKHRSYGDMIYANGDTVPELLRDFAAKLNEARDEEKITLDALAPYLPGQ